MIPFDRQIWTAQECAEYLRISRQHFLTAIRHAEGFPAPLPRKTYPHQGKIRQMEDYWPAAAVAEWAFGESEQKLHKNEAAA